MSITIQGIRLVSISVSDLKSTDSERINGTYEIISSADKVLAKQFFNSYGGMKIPPSPATSAAFDAFIASLKDDISSTIGI